VISLVTVSSPAHYNTLSEDETTLWKEENSPQRTWTSSRSCDQRSKILAKLRYAWFVPHKAWSAHSTHLALVTSAIEAKSRAANTTLERNFTQTFSVEPGVDPVSVQNASTGQQRTAGKFR
jgi:hypothetical protein